MVSFRFQNKWERWRMIFVTFSRSTQSMTVSIHSFCRCCWCWCSDRTTRKIDSSVSFLLLLLKLDCFFPFVGRVSFRLSIPSNQEYITLRLVFFTFDDDDDDLGINKKQQDRIIVAGRRILSTGIKGSISLFSFIQGPRPDDLVC